MTKKKSVTVSSASCGSGVPKLTEEEHALHFKHLSCFKCQKEYQDHKVTNCPNGFLDSATYKRLTDNILLRYKKSGLTSCPGTNTQTMAVVTMLMMRTLWLSGQ